MTKQNREKENRENHKETRKSISELDVKIERLEGKIEKLEKSISNLEERFETFCENEFYHLRDRVDWIFWVFLLGTIVSVAISYLTRTK